MTDASRAEPAARTPDGAAARRRPQWTAVIGGPTGSPTGGPNGEPPPPPPRAAVRRLRLCVAQLPLAEMFAAVLSPLGTMSIAP